MGVGVSNWRLAKAVAKLGQLGVVSGTGLETVIIRRLQLGDLDGSIRRALANFPWPDMAQNVLKKYFIAEGKEEKKPFLTAEMPSLKMKPAGLELTVISNFVEVFLAKEGHKGQVGVNYLEKIQLPTMASLLGAMLAGVNFVLMGGGIPVAIPGVLDELAQWNPVELRLNVADNADKTTYMQPFNPADYFSGPLPQLERPHFLAIVSSDIIAHSMLRRATGHVDGFIVENHIAGGHNAPPRRVSRAKGDVVQGFSEKDVPNIEKIRQLGRPFWLAGACASPEKLRDAQSQGAHGVQVGSAFCYSEESGMMPSIKEEVIAEYLRGTLKIETDFRASPTGYPFKLTYLKNSSKSAEAHQNRTRVCDLGYLRQPYCKPDGTIGYRCPAEPVEQYVKKGGNVAETAGRQCLCNSLAAAIGLGQVRPDGVVLPAITAGEDFAFLDHLVTPDDHAYSAKDVIDYLTGPVNELA